MFDPEEEESEEETKANEKRAAKWQAIMAGQFYEPVPHKEQN
jgi:hypothetical protein